MEAVLFGKRWMLVGYRYGVPDGGCRVLMSALGAREACSRAHVRISATKSTEILSVTRDAS